MQNVFSYLKKHISQLIIVFSLVFLVIYLMQHNLINLSLLRLNESFYVSLIFLFLGFVLSGFSWWYAVVIHKVKISILFGILSHGLPIFTKYIPGKIWTILGRASKVASHTNKPVSELSFISLKEQLVYLLIGILISIVPVYLLYGLSFFFMFVLLSGMGLGLIIFNKNIHNLMLWVLGKFMKKPLELPLLSIKNGLKLSFFNVLLWIAWTLAFYFFGCSIEDSFGLNHAFVFPISVVYGVLAIFMPGGIGVRESIITAYLVLSGVEIELATTISVLSRIWFMLGEVFIFLLALLLQLIKRF
jgi:hypothetical protein